MHVHFEQNISSRTECTIHSLTWMGKVPDSLPGEGTGGWKLNRGQYYSEGWLASGNAKGIVGVTFTTSHCRKYDPPNRSNFNLRGHRSEVVLVRWNEPYQKLATCDSQGIIFVWIKHEGRWSIELINDRNSQVTDFAWSHDGRMALICYCDGFVLVGSVAGQRYWSSMLNLDNTAITCGVWSPDDQKVMFGTTDGQIIIMSSTGAMVAQVTLLEGMEITTMLWSCEKFNMEESEANKDGSVQVMADQDDVSPTSEKAHTLAVCFKYGAIYLMNNYDDVCPKVVHTLLTGLRLDWSNCGEFLAVGGFTRLPNLQCQNEIHFYSTAGDLKHWISVPSQGKPLTALCWGHNDRRLFVAAGYNLYVAWISKNVPGLQYLSQRVIQSTVRVERNVEKLPLPTCLCANVQALFSPTIKSYIPDPFKLREFVSTAPPGSERLFCTMVRHGEETSGGHYTLYLEYLGGLIPLLKGKRASKLRPDFVIFDPKIRAKGFRKDDIDREIVYDELSTSTSSSDSDIETDGCGGSPRVQRRRRQKNFRAERVERSTTFRTLNDLFYNDNLPESSKLVEVTSNIWGTKFRLLGTAAHLPEDLGNVLYKTSLLHLQPRQMTVTVTEMPKDDSLLSQDRNFSPAGLNDDDEDNFSQVEGVASAVSSDRPDNNIPLKLESHIELTNQINADVISVDVLTNHCELSGTMEEVLECNPVTNSVCYTDRQNKPVCMKTKLSPASETHPQNSRAFNLGDPAVIKDSYIREGARPKVPVTPKSVHYSNQSSSDVSSVSSVAISNGAKSNFVLQNQTAAKTVPSQSQASSGSHLQDITDNKPVSETESGSLPCNGDIQGRPVELGSGKPVLSFVDALIRPDVQDNIPRWADPACQGIKFIDDDDLNLNKEIAYESNIVCDSSQTTPTPTDPYKRLYLEKLQEEEDSSNGDDLNVTQKLEDKPILSFGDHLERTDSIDSSGTEDETLTFVNPSDNLLSSQPDICASDQDISAHGSLDRGIDVLTDSLKSSYAKKTEFEITQSASLPASPIHRLTDPNSSKKLREDALKGKCKHSSPLFRRKNKYVNSLNSSEEDFSVTEDVRLNYSYKNLESFQKAQFKQKLKRVRSKGEDKKRSLPWNRQFVMHNKAPLWNENSQVYQLDFGGRVTQESAKNFQIEFRGKQVMQFGRIDSNAYTLDFQYPFTAIQAFAVALANVTQRLK